MSTSPLHSSQHLTDVTLHLEFNWQVLQSQPAGWPQKANTCPPREIPVPCSQQHCSQDGLRHPLSMHVEHSHGLICLGVLSETILA